MVPTMLSVMRRVAVVARAAGCNLASHGWICGRQTPYERGRKENRRFLVVVLAVVVIMFVVVVVIEFAAGAAAVTEEAVVAAEPGEAAVEGPVEELKKVPVAMGSQYEGQGIAVAAQNTERAGVAEEHAVEQCLDDGVLGDRGGGALRVLLPCLHLRRALTIAPCVGAGAVPLHGRGR
ncbi:hypothetical protein DFJ73DRAFT_845581 [Zopfochytrium polystomum]|nr:hypothetical protein DFJ73DRAFT_845581 [Zopfochytrium polystomum]